MENEQPVIIRPSRDADVEAMLAIYRHHIRRGIEEGVDDSGTPQPDDLRDRRKNLRNRRFPHLVATRGGEVVGYAYVVLFRKRPAYRYTVKHSIYVHHEHLGRGVGRLLMQRADRRLRGGRLPADDRLYRCRQHGVARACTRSSAFARVGSAARRRLSIRPLGRQRHGAALARSPARRLRHRPRLAPEGKRAERQPRASSVACPCDRASRGPSRVRGMGQIHP